MRFFIRFLYPKHFIALEFLPPGVYLTPVANNLGRHDRDGSFEYGPNLQPPNGNALC
jgi:hypothetical protein